ncbi:hypothetical protein PPYR_13226 [Photinus pyralis]|uniref:Uncharacterized protein n=1 Tax=Photinus pyralis TaxID=7054 RepID=A0A5N4A8E7_PHOPY|nr:uncharacterized protein LOC116177966 [Photinus pyralis]KAB0793606.1 hypothetical protein PPYR_13226 [Photinus pyralis]
MHTTVLFLLALACGAQGFLRTPKISRIDGLRLEFLQSEEMLWDMVFDDSDDNLVKPSTGENPEVGLIRKFQQFGDVLQKEFPHDLTYGLETIENVYVWAKTYAELRGVYALYESFRRFQILQTTPGRVPSPKQAWLDLAHTLLQTGKSSVMQAQTSITDFITSERLYDEALKETQGDMLCSTNQSAQQMLYNLYNTIELTELKGYMMMQFSYMLLKLYNQGNYTKEAQLMRDRYEERTVQSVQAVKKAMERSSREFWKCDPPKHIPGDTYIEVTQLLQGYVQNEVDLNPKGTCSETCAEYTYTKSHSCYKNLYCRQQRRCNGKIINCRYIDSDMWVCPADSVTNRRYEYIEYENGRVLGRKQGCQKGTVKVDSWWRWLFWHCSYCFCLCDEQGVYSDRYFNMRSAVADIANNRVVTGLRFTKKNRIIHLQIQEGKLLPHGGIDSSTIRWVPVEDYKITDRYIYNGQDYHTLTWEQRSIDLDDLIADDQHVMTGVRFKKIGTHLNFEIYITPFDFEKGQLLEPAYRSIWKDNSNTDASTHNPRTQVYLSDPDIPTRIPRASRLDSKTDQYIDFTHTDMNRDAAQTTVPFLDAQPVVPKMAVPLAGAGLYHKGSKNSGGFIAPKIVTYDYSQHLHPIFPKDELEINK